MNVINKAIKEEITPEKLEQIINIFKERFYESYYTLLLIIS